MIRRIMSLVAVLGALTSCATTSGPHVQRRISTGQVDASARDAAFARALGSLQRRGWILAVSDRAGGLLTTQTMDTGPKVCGSSTCPSRSTVQITIAEGGSVSVRLHREFYLDLSIADRPGRWFVPTLEPDVKPIEQEQDAILAEVLGSAAAQ